MVYYLARYTVEDANGGLRDLRFRSVDLYRREAQGWNQAGSNICLVPSLAAAAAATPRTLPPAEERALLEAREAVWRAWFAGDLEALAELVPPEALVLDPGASTWSDHDALRRASTEFRAGGGKLLALEFPATEFLVYGPVATLFTRYRVELESGGERQVMEGRGTELFVQRDGRWWNPSWHLAPAPGPDGAH